MSEKPEEKRACAKNGRGSAKGKLGDGGQLIVTQPFAAYFLVRSVFH